MSVKASQPLNDSFKILSRVTTKKPSNSVLLALCDGKPPAIADHLISIQKTHASEKETEMSPVHAAKLVANSWNTSYGVESINSSIFLEMDFYNVNFNGISVVRIDVTCKFTLCIHIENQFETSKACHKVIYVNKKRPVFQCNTM